jgi:hypothetical protein
MTHKRESRTWSGIGVTLIALFLLSGCAKSLDQKLAGSWTGNFEAAAADSEGMGAVEAGLAEAKINALEFNLVLDKNGTFQLEFLEMKTEGTWSAAGTQLNLETTKANGEAVSPPSKDSLSIGGSVDSLVMSDPEGTKESRITFERTPD